jgi:membrane glycosyltransferase
MGGIFATRIGPHRRPDERRSAFLRRFALFYGFSAIAFLVIEIVLVTVLMSIVEEPNDIALSAIMVVSFIWAILFFAALIGFLASVFYRYREQM